VEVVRANIDFTDLQWTNDIRLHGDHIFLVLKLALDQQEFAIGDNAAGAASIVWCVQIATMAEFLTSDVQKVTVTDTGLKNLSATS
jgi:hypothetical protein